MSILIKGMTMPKGESCVTVRIWGDGRVIGVHNDSLVKHAIELPPHGRLIDADALKESIHCTDTDERKILSTRDLHNALIEWIDMRSTIIEAEE